MDMTLLIQRCFYTSGSTGKPKGTVHTQGGLWRTAELYGKAVLGLTDKEVCFSVAKLYFAYGLGNSLAFPLSVGATVFSGAPNGFAGMFASPRLPHRSLVALRMCSSAGEALSAEIAQRFKDHFGCDIVDGIGSTEKLHIFLSNRPGDVRYGSTGKPVQGHDIALRGEDCSEVPQGEIGDLYIHGPSAALMYWNNRAKTGETFQGAWTKSGDKYVRDAEGYDTDVARSDDIRLPISAPGRGIRAPQCADPCRPRAGLRSDGAPALAGAAEPAAATPRPPRPLRAGWW